MREKGCTPLEVHAVLELRDNDLAVRCLTLLQSYLPSILPVGSPCQVELIALCHHHLDNIYPAFGMFSPHTWEECVDAEKRINAWVAERGISWLVAESEKVEAPTWDSLRATGAGPPSQPFGVPPHD